jgi:hypothetical protein
MKHKRTGLVVLAALLGAGVLFSVLSYRRGKADFIEAQEGRAPVYSHHSEMLGDGGTACFSGWGYRVYVLHRILQSKDDNPRYGHLGGAELHWRLPLRVLLSDEQYHYYIPPAL